MVLVLEMRTRGDVYSIVDSNTVSAYNFSSWIRFAGLTSFTFELSTSVSRTGECTVKSLTAIV